MPRMGTDDSSDESASTGEVGCFTLKNDKASPVEPIMLRVSAVASA